MVKTRQRKSRIRRKRTRSSTGRGLDSASSEIRSNLYLVNTADYSKTLIQEDVTEDQAKVAAQNYSTQHNCLPLKPPVTYNRISNHWSFSVTGQRKTPAASSKK